MARKTLTPQQLRVRILTTKGKTGAVGAALLAAAEKAEVQT